jgi:ABC-type lipoprotein export system ATPase subunit
MLAGAGVIVVTHDRRALDVFNVVSEVEDGVIPPASAELVNPVLPAPS